MLVSWEEAAHDSTGTAGISHMTTAWIGNCAAGAFLDRASAAAGQGAGSLGRTGGGGRGGEARAANAESCTPNADDNQLKRQRLYRIL